MNRVIKRESSLHTENKNDFKNKLFSYRFNKDNNPSKPSKYQRVCILPKNALTFIGEKAGIGIISKLIFEDIFWNESLVH